MKKARTLYFDDFPHFLLFILLVFFLIASTVAFTSNEFSILDSHAYGHLSEIPGDQSNVMSKSIGSYVVLFQRIPSSPEVGDNSDLLRFSIMQNNQDTYGVFAALIIREKGSDHISAEFPYKFYEFGDIDFSHNFQNAVDHEVILQARIAGDPQYQNNPLVASFDIPVENLGIGGTFLETIVILTLVALAVGIVVIFRQFNKRAKRASTSK
jgi:hypothetical protein